MADSASQPASAGLWQYASMLAGVGAFSGSVVAVISEDLSGLVAVGAIATGVVLTAVFAYLLGRLGLFLFRKFCREEWSEEPGRTSRDRQVKLLYASLIIWFALFDWIGYVTVRGLFNVS